MQSNYRTTVNTFLAKPSNLYSIQLRPRVQDPISEVVNPVFTVNRGNDARGNPLSPLYDQMHAMFPSLKLGIADPRERLIDATLIALPHGASFEDIQRVLTAQCQTLFNAPVDFTVFIKQLPDVPSERIIVDKDYVNREMGFGDDANAEDYIRGLLGYCATNLWTTLPGSPFYLGIYNT